MRVASASNPAALRAWVDSDRLWVELVDGRVLGVPLRLFPRLAHASAAQREAMELGPSGLGLSWPVLDEDISVAGLLEGRGDETNEARKHRATCGRCGPCGVTPVTLRS
jgi:hypothetical protein